MGYVRKGCMEKKLIVNLVQQNSCEGCRFLGVNTDWISVTNPDYANDPENQLSEIRIPVVGTMFCTLTMETLIPDASVKDKDLRSGTVIAKARKGLNCLLVDA